MKPILSVVIPLRNRPVAMLRRTLEALRYQDQAYPTDIILVSNGNTPQENQQFRDLRAVYGTQLIAFNNHPVWNKSLTSNIGIRYTSESCKYVMTMDTDILLAPNFFKALFSSKNLEKSFITCNCGMLRENVKYPKTITAKDYEVLRKTAVPPTAPHHGIGGIQFSTREFFFTAHGYDEGMTYWGSMDSDMADRAKRHGMQRQWLNKFTTMIHQPHTKKFRILKTPALQTAAKKAHVNNKRIRHGSSKNTVVRNKDGWGEI